MKTRHFGGPTLHLASRVDQVFLKLSTAANHGTRSKHFQDLQLLFPERLELVDAAAWSRTHDPSAGYRTELVRILQALGIEDADAVV